MLVSSQGGGGGPDLGGVVSSVSVGGIVVTIGRLKNSHQGQLPNTCLSYWSLVALTNS